MPDELPSEPGFTPVPQPTPITPVPAAAPAGSGLAPNVAAGIAALFTVIGGIVMLVIEKQDKFVRFWAMQSLFFGVAFFGFSIGSGILQMILSAIFRPLGWLWMLVSLIVYLVFFAVWVITIIQAFSGKEWEIPYLGKLARQQLAKTPTLP